MKQLGNLAVVCAQRPDVLMQIYGSEVRCITPLLNWSYRQPRTVRRESFTVSRK